jgi:hypothetical protein
MIKRYFATKDNTITNAFQEDLVTRGTGSNMGQADILEVFSIYGQVSSSTGLSNEKSRVIIQFDTTTAATDRTAGRIPQSGGVSWYLKLYNAKHSQTLPRNYTLEVLAVSASWEEGLGLDMEGYTDLTYGVKGSNWLTSSTTVSWKKPHPNSADDQQGGSFHASPTYNTTFDVGTEDLEVDVTTLVEDWLSSAVTSKTNYGFGIKLLGEEEDSKRSYYTKKFFARSTSYHFSKPVLEARWDSSIRDDRGNFYLSSSLVPGADNLNTLYLYNYARGQLTNIPTIDEGLPYIMVSMFSGSSDDSAPSGSALILTTDGTNVATANPYVVTGGWVSTGIYSASFAYTGSSTIDTIYDVWFSGSNTIADASTAALQFNTGSTTVKRFSSSQYSETDKYVLSVSNRNNTYYKDQTHRIRLYARQKNWSPNVYTTATSVPNSLIFPSASYQVYRVVDDRVVIPYNTGSTNGTRLSYDVSGNYFDLDTSMLEGNYTYGIKISVYDPDTLTYEEQPFTYKLRVTKNEY